METEVIKLDNVELEDGECSDSDGGYVPLQRPGTVITNPTDSVDMVVEDAVNPFQNNKIPTDYQEENSFSDISHSSQDSDTDSCMKAFTATNESSSKSKKKKKHLIVKRDIPNKKPDRFKKYNIWTASLQEESLMENMRVIDVTNKRKYDRSVESYDFTLKYRLGKGNALKRRLSNSGNDSSDDGHILHQQEKRPKPCSSKDQKFKNRKNRSGRRSSTSSCDSQNAPRYILDLNTTVNSECEEIARDIANKLYEEKDDLVLRAVEVLGKDIPIQLFKETQRIEKDGGMMIMNGVRRRTPGGVFLFLLKHHDIISPEQKKLIFEEEEKKSKKDRKILQAIKRDKKVEELKKCLANKEKELLVHLCTRAEVIANLKTETETTLSNPPPSPVTNGGLENSPEYTSLAINHVSDE